jgi:hypothetical protein
MPDHFKIFLIPSEISCWLISLLQKLPVSEQLREQQSIGNTTATQQQHNSNAAATQLSKAP